MSESGGEVASSAGGAGYDDGPGNDTSQLISGKMIEIHQQAGVVNAYLSVPKKATTFRGAVIVVHEIWGLTNHIKRVSDRLASQGYFVLAPDLYSGKKTDRTMSVDLQRDLFSPDERVRYAAQPKFRALVAPTQTPQFTSMALHRLASCFEYMYNQPLVHQRVAVVGFGLGGTYAYSMAVHEPRLLASVPFYGHSSTTSYELRHINCPILAFYGGKDTALKQELQRLSPQMHVAGVDYTAVVFSGSGHAFFNDDNVFAYDPGASADAWGRMLSFLNEHMG